MSWCAGLMERLCHVRRLARVEERQDVRVLETRRRPDLGQESRFAFRLSGNAIGPEASSANPCAGVV